NPPLWRDDFIAALKECGTYNFDLYEVAIRDPDDGTVHTNYKAVNVLGLVVAADMDKSTATVHDGIPLIERLGSSHFFHNTFNCSKRTSNAVCLCFAMSLVPGIHPRKPSKKIT
ncbi:hypothetical protein MNBD_GAMMA16-323, partial [hydrothermal vent metagenome]